MKIKTILEYKLEGQRNNTPRQPIIFSDKLFVIFTYDKKGVIESKLQCLNPADFSLLWEYTYSHVLINLIGLENGTLLTSCMKGEIICFNIQNGNKIWECKSSDGQIGVVSNEETEKVVFSGIGNHNFTYCLNSTNGDILWKVPNTGHSYTPFIHNQKIFNCIGNNIYCLELSTGSIFWEAHEPNTYIFNPIVFSDFVIVGGHDLINVYEINTGKKIDSIIIENNRSRITQIISDLNNIYFGDSSGYFYCYFFEKKTKFNLKWKVETKGNISSLPAIFKDSVLVINDASQLLSFNKNDGQLQYKQKIKGEAGSSGIIIDNNKIYFSCKGGNVYKCQE